MDISPIEIITILFPHSSVAIFFMFGFSGLLSAFHKRNISPMFYAATSFFWGGLAFVSIKNYRFNVEQNAYVYGLFICLIGVIVAMIFLLKRYININIWTYFINSKLLLYILRIGWFFCFSSALLLIYLQ
jgi:hypothetical protein